MRCGGLRGSWGWMGARRRRRKRIFTMESRRHRGRLNSWEIHSWEIENRSELRSNLIQEFALCHHVLRQRALQHDEIQKLIHSEQGLNTLSEFLENLLFPRIQVVT